MWSRVKSLILGSPLPTEESDKRLLSNFQALAAFSPDALSSIAYANQEIYLGLAVAGSAGLILTWPVGLAITLLLTLVALSYLQTIPAYPSGGGSYAVTRANLGTVPSLLTAAALLIGYLLTAAVSLSAAVAAIASAFPALWPYQVWLALGFLAIMTLANLRGLRESGTFMAVPVYLFLGVYLSMLACGIVRLIVEGPGSLSGMALPATKPVTAGLVLHAFSSGCTALTGIEAISNGVPAFRPPAARNASRSLLVMAMLMGLLFAGSIGLTQALAVTAGPEETILSALARRILGNEVAYLAVQSSTMLILAVAANTSFAGFPRLLAILAENGYAPRQFRSLGERLVFSKGILFLSVATGVLIVVFGADTHALVPLFAVGVFLAFTLSQAGMVIHWCRERGPRWVVKMMLNGIGALATGVTVLIVGVSKFLGGAWISVVLMPMLVVLFLKIRAHYDEVSSELSLASAPPPAPMVPPRVVVPISSLHRGVLEAVAYALSISKDVTAVYVELEPGSGERIRAKWELWHTGVPLVVIPSRYRTIVKPLLEYLDWTDREHEDGQLATVVLPELVTARWWHGLLHNQTAWLIKTALLYRRRNLGFQRAIIDIPYHLQR